MYAITKTLNIADLKATTTEDLLHGRFTLKVKGYVSPELLSELVHRVNTITARETDDSVFLTVTDKPRRKDGKHKIDLLAYNDLGRSRELTWLVSLFS